MRMRRTKNLIVAAMCTGLWVVRPMAFHMIPNAGSIFLPMHLPVLLCGFLCGWPYGLCCGFLGPVLSSLLTGMPPAAFLPGMACELAVYGLVTGLLFPLVRTRSRTANVYVTLVAAMLCGRAVSGVLNALIFRAGDYSMQIWFAASFTTALPGIAIQLVLIPALILVLEKAGAVEPQTNRT